MILPIIYPFIFSLFPILSLYLKNYNEVSLGDVIYPSFFNLILTLLIFAGGLISTRSIRKTSLITFIFIFFIFSFEPFFSPFTARLSFEQLLVIYPRYFAFWILSFSLSVVSVLLADSQLKIVNRFLAYFSVFLILSSLVRLIILKPWTNAEAFTKKAETFQVLSSQTGSESDLPDIYYIIMDRYLGDSVLQKKYGFDNNPFINFLEDKDFYVARESRSNYLKTAHSLASSLNMQYINYLSQDIGETSSNWMPLYSLIEENEVAKVLKSKGYKYFHLGSWWEATRESDIADVNVNSDIFSEFSQNLFKNTVFYPVHDQLFSDDVRQEQMNRSLYEMDFIKKIPLDKDPTYTFAHFLITHPPYVFDENGNYLTGDVLSKMTEKEIYVAQVKYANKLLEDLINEIFSKSEKKPVIVIQSDEGKYPVDKVQLDHRFDWFKATPDQVEEKLSILNAVYIPDVDKSVFRPTITPVNTFRIIFNEIFDAKMELLPDESFLHQNNLNLYRFKKLE